MDHASSRSLAWAAAGVWLVVSGWLLAFHYGDLGLRLGDSDDAMRLVEARELIAGRGWFDLTLARVDPPHGLPSHWSRLIDAGLAGLYFAALPFTAPQTAETLMRGLWPLLWLLPTIAGVMLIALRLVGPPAALLTAVFSLLATPGHEQFVPGRIDHHNVQIALAVMGVAAAVWADRSRPASFAAGALAGLMLAIGLENAPFIVLVIAVFTLRWLLADEVGQPMRNFGLALAAFSFLALLISVPPGNWFEPACDAVAINTALPIVLTGTLLAGAAGAERLRRSLASRFFALTAVAAAAVASFVWLDPTCLHGPFAAVDPAVRAAWLDHVKESRSFLESLGTQAPGAIGAVAYPVLALGAAAYLLLQPAQRVSAAAWTAAAASLMSLALALFMIRTFSYAVWLAMPVVAAAVVEWWKARAIARLEVRAATAILATPIAATLAAVLLAQVAGLRPDVSSPSSGESRCLATTSYGALSRLPPALVAASINLGPAILANTPHAILAAPYHRLKWGILDNQRLFAGTAAEAGEVARRRGVHYVVFCREFPLRGVVPEVQKTSLWADLASGRVPAWLMPIELQDGPFAVYRVVPR